MKETREQFIEKENHARTLVRQGYCGEESNSSWVNRQRRAGLLGLALDAVGLDWAC